LKLLGLQLVGLVFSSAFLVLIKKRGANMAATVDELTIEYVEDGLTTVKELDKIVLTKGAWSTIIYRYQDWNRSKEEYGPDKYSIRRYQKRDGEYKPKSKFNISSADQAQKVIDALAMWIKEGAQ
jgi:hypothetical protein